MMRFFYAALLLLAGASTAAADIRIDQSHYINGTLAIAGRTEPDKTVVLDGKYKTKSDGTGFFKFTEHHKSDICMSDIRPGGDEYSAVIAGCFDPSLGNGALPLDPTSTTPDATPPTKKAVTKPKP